MLSRRFLFSLTLCSFIAVYQMSSCSQIVFVPNELFADLNAGGGVRIPVCPAALNKKPHKSWSKATKWVNVLKGRFSNDRRLNVIMWLRLLRLKSRVSFATNEKQNQIYSPSPCTHDFSRPLRKSREIEENPDWFIALFTPAVLFGIITLAFNSKTGTVIWKPLQIQWSFS